MTGPAIFPTPAAPLTVPGGDQRERPPIFPVEPQDDPSLRLRQSARLGVQQPPDSAARVLSLRARTGLPAEFITRNLDTVEQEASRKDFDAARFRETNPAVSKWLAEHPDHFAAARDDLSQLSAIEASIQALTRGAKIGAAQSRLGTIGAEAMFRRGDLDEATRRRVDDLNAQLEREPTGRGFLTNVLFQGAKIIGQMSQALPQAAEGAVKGGLAGGLAGFAGGPGAPVTVPSAALTGAGIGAGAGFLASTFHVEAGQTYLELSKIRGENGETIDETTKQVASIGVGIANSLLEAGGMTAIALPFKRAASTFVRESARDMLVRPTMRRAMAEFGKSYAEAIAGETTTEVLQEMTNIAAEELAKMSSHGQFASIMRDPEQREQAVQRLADIALQTAQGMLLVGFPGAGVTLASHTVQAKRASEREAYFLALGEGVQNSKTFERLPEALQTIVQEATKDGPIETVYLDREAFDEYFQSGDAEIGAGDPREAARQLWGNTVEYDQAGQTGAALAIPMHTYATKIAPTKANATFARELRLAPDDLNAREREELAKQAEEQAKAATQEPAQDPAAEVGKIVSEQLVAAGFEPQTAETMASALYESFFRTMGQRAGVDPLELFKAFGLEVTKEEAPALTSDQTLNQPGDPGERRILTSVEELQAAIPHEPAQPRVDIGTQALRDAHEAELARLRGEPARDADAVVRDLGERVFDQPAFHGSPHIFDKFSLHAIGSGEGAQAFGWGLYFAGKKEIAQYYRDALSSRNGPIEFNALTAEENAALARDDAEYIASTKYVGGFLSGEMQFRLVPGFENVDRYAIVKKLRESGDYSIQPRGRLYKVEIPGDDTMLLWDRSFSEQPEKVRAALDRAGLAEMVQTQKDDGALSPNAELADLTGENIYNVLRTRADPEGKAWDASAEDASRALSSLGVDGIKYLDASSRDSGEGTFNYVIFDDQLVQITDFEQTGQKGPKGRIRIGKTGGIKIELFPTMNLSTFLHETGHFYLEVLGDLATGEEAAPEISRDYATILTWLGVENRSQLSVEQHEQFARGIEAYLMEGKAPSQALRRAFFRFSAWLKTVYRSLKGLDVKLTNDVRGVLDRLFASETEIEAAESEARIVPIFTTAEDAGMTDERFAAYQQTVEDAHISAVDSLRTKLMQEKAREKAQWWKEEKARTRAEVEREIDQQPIYVALATLQEKGEEAVKLSKAAILEMYGDEGKAMLARLPRPYVYTKDGGLHPNMVAERFGFSSGDELLKALANAPKRAQAIEAETDERMTVQYGDMLVDGRIADEAEAAVLGGERERVIRAELRALNAKAREVKPFEQGVKAEQKAAQQRGRAVIGGVPDAETVKRIAEERIATLRSRDLKPHTFWVWARKASAEATKALASQDYVTAANAKQAELLNLALYREALRVRADIDGIVDYARKLQKPSIQERLAKSGADYRDQINKILERFDFAPITLKDVDRRAGLASFIKSQEDQKIPVNIPEEIQNEAFRKPWREMTYEELVGVRDTLKHLDHLSQLKTRLLKAQDEREFREIEAEATTSIGENAKRTIPRKIETRLPQEENLRTIDGYFASHRKLASFIREMDGFKDNGVMWNLVMRRVNGAGDAKALVNQEMTQTLDALFVQAYSKEDMLRMYTREYQPTLHESVSKMGRIMMALNWGAKDNRDKLVAGLSTGPREITDSQVEAVLDTLDARDWQFVQGIWDAINHYWPQLKALDERLNGIAVEKIEAMPVQTRFGEMRGGYFPMAYDDRQSGTAHEHVVKKRASQIERGAAARNSTKAGARNARVKGVEMPVRLDFGVIFQHFDEIAMDITHTEALIDVQRIIRSDAVSSAIHAHYGEVVYKQILSALEDIAAGDAPAQEFIDKAANWMRQGSSIAGLGWNLVTSALQPFGITQSMVRIGPKWVAKGMSRWLRDASHMENSLRWIQEKSTFMQTRTSTQMREISEIRNKIGLTRGKAGAYLDFGISKATADKIDLADVEDSFFYFITRAQLVADIPTWLGGYEKALASGVDESTAIALADQGVIDAQGSGSIKDLAGIQRGSPLKKLWTNFYSFFNTTLQLHYESVGRTNFKSMPSVGRLVVDFLLLSIIPASLGYMLRAALKGDDMEPDKLVRENLSYLLGLFVGVREMGSFVQGFTGYEGPAGTRLISDLGKFLKQVEQGDADRAFWTALNKTAGSLFHYPAAQVQRTVDGLTAWLDGRTRNPAAILFGPSRN